MGASGEPDAIDSKYVGRDPCSMQKQQRAAAQTLGISAPVDTGQRILQKQDDLKATRHSTKHCKQLDHVLTHEQSPVRTLHRCRKNGTDRHENQSHGSDSKNRTTNQQQDSPGPSSNGKGSKAAKGEAVMTKLIGANTRSAFFQAHQDQALNTTNPNRTTSHATTEELRDKLGSKMTNSASTTENDQPLRTTQSRRRLLQKRNTAPPEDRRTKKGHKQDDQEKRNARSETKKEDTTSQTS